MTTTQVDKVRIVFLCKLRKILHSISSLNFAPVGYVKISRLFNCCCCVYTGYAIVWDNTQKLVQTRDQCRSTSNKMMMWANAFAVRNRVPSTPVLTSTLYNLPAREVSLTAFLPNAADLRSVRQRMESIVARIAADNMELFRDVAVNRHLLHDYSAQSALKSQTVRYFYTHTHSVLSHSFSNPKPYSCCSLKFIICA